MVNREHVGALSPADGSALEWNPGSISYEGNKAMEATPRGIFTGGDTPTQGGVNVGRIAFYDFNSVPAGNGVETVITEPISGRVNPTAEEWTVKGTAQVSTGSVARVDLEVYDRQSEQYLADNLTSWSDTFNTIEVNLATTGAVSTDWSQPLTIIGNRKLLLRARTASSTGVVDNTKAVKKTETFGFTNQPPNTDVTGLSAALVKTMTFTVTGTATDDVGVNSIGLRIQDGDNRYLQEDGSVSATSYTFRFAPDVVGALSTNWSKEITVPTEGFWKARARATDTTGESDLDTGDRQWIVSEDGAAPTVSIGAPATMIPPTAAPTLVVAPGGPLTFSGSAEDDGTLNNVQIRLRNTTTRENLSVGGVWGPDLPMDWHTISPVSLDESSYNWSYTTPFNLRPGSYSFEVRATDDLGLQTASADQGKLSINAQVVGDAAPDARLNVTGTVTGGQTLQLDLAGTATDNLGVSDVRVTLLDGDTSRYLQPDGTLATAYAELPATLATPGATSTTWTYGVALPQGGDWNVTALAFDTVGQQDTSTSGATARYRIYPGDVPPTMTENLLAPEEGTTFTDGRIFVSGRSEDDQAMQRVEVAVVNSVGRYMNASGAFPNTTVTWITAFLTSPGTVGSNFSFSTPVVPAGAYTVRVRDGQPRPGHGGAVRATRHGDAPGGQHRPGGGLLGLVHRERLHVRRSHLDRRGRRHADLRMELRQRHRHRGAAHADLHHDQRGQPLHRDPDRDRRVGHLQRAGEQDGHDHRTDGQRRADARDQPAGVHEPDLQLLRGRVGGPQHGRHVHLLLELRCNRREHEHLDRCVTHVPWGRHLHGDAHHHGRLGQGELGDQGHHVHGAGEQRRAHACDQHAGVHKPDLQLLQRRIGGPQHRRHVHLQVGLRDHRPGDEHLGQPVGTHVPRGRHLHGDADDD